MPKRCDGPLVRVDRQEVRPVEGLVDVLEDDEGLADCSVTVEEHAHYGWPNGPSTMDRHGPGSKKHDTSTARARFHSVSAGTGTIPGRAWAASPARSAGTINGLTLWWPGYSSVIHFLEKHYIMVMKSQIICLLRDSFVLLGCF